MTWKRKLMEAAVWSVSRCARAEPQPPLQPRSIFVLRNNDLGDVLVVTPLFEALHRRFPEARLVAGVGDWAAPLLAGNPHVSAVLPINAPWHNNAVAPQGMLRALRYIYGASEPCELAGQHCDIGVDVLGSSWGALLLLRGGIPYRLGMRGYAGGHTAMQRCVPFHPFCHVGRLALEFAELLGATAVPEVRPQIFLTPEERAAGEARWRQFGSPLNRLTTRIVVGPGGGFPAKCWPLAYWCEFARILSEERAGALLVVGGRQDQRAGEQIAQAHPLVRTVAGQTSLRETCALVAQADLVLCNSSLLMHVAAAFQKPAIVLLGPCFASARLHAAQWGYEGLTVVLGKEVDHPRIFTPIEAFAVIEQAFCPQSLAA